MTVVRILAFAVIAIALLLAGILRWRSWIDAPRAETRYLAIALMAFGLAFLLNIPPVVTTLDRHVWHLANGTILATCSAS